MPRRCAFIFGLLGFLLATWAYWIDFWPMTCDACRTLLWVACLGCVNIFALHHARVGLGVLVFAPLNALIYAAVGFLAGKLVAALKRAW